MTQLILLFLLICGNNILASLTPNQSNDVMNKNHSIQAFAPNAEGEIDRALISPNGNYSAYTLTEENNGSFLYVADLKSGEHYKVGELADSSKPWKERKGISEFTFSDIGLVTTEWAADSSISLRLWCPAFIIQNFRHDNGEVTQHSFDGFNEEGEYSVSLKHASPHQEVVTHLAKNGKAFLVVADTSPYRRNYELNIVTQDSKIQTVDLAAENNNNNNNNNNNKSSKASPRPLYLTTSPDGKLGALLSENYNEKQFIKIFSLATGKPYGNEIQHDFGRICHADFYFSQDSKKLVLLGKNTQTMHDLVVDCANLNDIKPYFIAPEIELSAYKALRLAVRRTLGFGITEERIDQKLAEKCEKIFSTIVKFASIDRNNLVKTFKETLAYYKEEYAHKYAEKLLKPFNFDKKSFWGKSASEQEEIIRKAPYDPNELLKAINENSVSTNDHEKTLVEDLWLSFLKPEPNSAQAIPDALLKDILVKKQLKGFTSIPNQPNQWALHYFCDKYPVIWNIEEKTIADLKTGKKSGLVIEKANSELVCQSNQTCDILKRAAKGTAQKSVYYDLEYIRTPKYPNQKLLSHSQSPLLCSIDSSKIVLSNTNQLKRVGTIPEPFNDIKSIEYAEKGNYAILVATKKNLHLIKNETAKTEAEKLD